jgi:hypothetical protein
VKPKELEKPHSGGGKQLGDETASFNVVKGERSAGTMAIGSAMRRLLWCSESVELEELVKLSGGGDNRLGDEIPHFAVKSRRHPAFGNRSPLWGKRRSCVWGGRWYGQQ